MKRYNKDEYENTHYFVVKTSEVSAARLWLRPMEGRVAGASEPHIELLRDFCDTSESWEMQKIASELTKLPVVGVWMVRRWA